MLTDQTEKLQEFLAKSFKSMGGIIKKQTGINNKTRDLSRQQTLSWDQIPIRLQKPSSFLHELRRATKNPSILNLPSAILHRTCSPTTKSTLRTALTRDPLVATTKSSPRSRLHPSTTKSLLPPNLAQQPTLPASSLPEPGQTPRRKNPARVFFRNNKKKRERDVLGRATRRLGCHSCHRSREGTYQSRRCLALALTVLLGVGDLLDLLALLHLDLEHRRDVHPDRDSRALARCSRSSAALIGELRCSPL